MNKISSSELELVFLTNCKFFSKQNIENAVNLVPLLKVIKKIFDGLNKQSMTSSQEIRQSSKGHITYTNNSNALDNLINEHIQEEYLFEGSECTFENFQLKFDDVWIPSEGGHFKKMKS